MVKVACSVCGVAILEITATANGGKCFPCRNGTRGQLEASRRRIAEERARPPDPARVYWLSLVDRVYRTDAGYGGLSRPEQLYFAVCCLDGEAYNGGLEQFFLNESGSRYRDALEALRLLGAANTAHLLERAKEACYPAADVPEDWPERRRLLIEGDTPSRRAQLDALDDEYYADPDGLADRIQDFARQHSLY